MKNSKLFLPAVVGGLFVFTLAVPASAAGPVPVVSTCHEGWYVNADEAALLPKQVQEGFLFDGPGLVHHATTPVALADVPAVGFTATSVTGAKPLFKMETTAPYSTVNVLPDGTAWSSKIDVAADGGQNKPVTLEALGALTPYTDGTRVVTFGVGYGNDTGNKATVTSIKFGTTYELTCTPTQSPSASPSPTKTVTATPSATPTKSATATPTPSRTTQAPAGTVTTTAVAGNTGGLPVTGSKSSVLFLGGAAAVLIGAAGLLWARRNRDETEFEA